MSADPLPTLLTAIEAALAETDGDRSRIEDAQRRLQDVAAASREAARGEIATVANLLAGLLEIAACSETGDDPESERVLGFARAQLPLLQNALNDDPEASHSIAKTLHEAEQRWGEYLHLVQTEAPSDAADWTLDDVAAADDSDDEASLEEGQLALILNSLGAKGSTPFPSDEVGERQSQQQPAAAAQPRQPTAHSPQGTSPAVPGPPPPAAAIDIDEELLAAYLDDATRCLASLEEQLLQVEANPKSDGPRRQMARELHTLKGASGSVGLDSLAQYLHRIEDYVISAGDSFDIELMLQGVDAIRSQIETLQGSASFDAPPAATTQPAATTPPVASAGPRPNAEPAAATQAAQPEESLRVKASRLDRLMDLLAELVILRNRRDTRLAQLKQLHGELIRCVSRMRVIADGSDALRSLPSAGAAPAADASCPSSTDSFSEIASDVSEFARCLRELCEPMAHENETVSEFIRHFRQELVELRRVPISGLFRRLQRSARDAARAEGKQVRLVLCGEQTGLERSLLERLYEPLLHLVRNAVSHGIEDSQRRAASGKDAVGTVTLAAEGDTSTLVIEVSDDGGGMDYAAIRRRGLELGLLSRDETTDERQLARLVFHPGFSTKSEASEISGRGVGMDVVAGILERLQSSIDVDSTPGKGTRIRLTIPLHSAIEHVMVFRVDQQLFAVPMQFVHAAGSRDESAADIEGDGAPPPVRLRESLSLNSSPRPAQESTIILSAQQGALRADKGAQRGRSAVLVDHVVGPEEVVIRALPPLLKRHRLLAGGTLSGAGEIVLLFDAPRLIEWLAQGSADVAPPVPLDDLEPATTPARKALVVDDSLSARRHLMQLLRLRNFDITEAGDGLEALDHLRAQPFEWVFTDLEMPRLGGLELLSEIKSSRRTRAARVVVVSGAADESLADRACKLGAEAFIGKPASEQALEAFFSRSETAAASPENH